MLCLAFREDEAALLGLATSKQTEDALSVHAPIAVTAWMGKGSINILVSKGTPPFCIKLFQCGYVSCFLYMLQNALLL